MAILLTGGSGLLGTDIVRAAQKRNIPISAPSHAAFDITNPKSVAAGLKKYKPDIVINAAAMVSVDECEARPDAAYLINRDGVRNMLEAVKKNKKPIVFVQVSSSEVFGRIYAGQYKINGYAEEEPPMPFTAYQKSKAEAEEITADICVANPALFPQWYVARAGWLFGKARPTFVEQFAKAIKAGEALNAVKDQWRTPTWTAYFADALLSLVAGKYENGFYHIAAESKPGEATTAQVIEEIKRILGPKAKDSAVNLVSRDEIFKVPRAPSNVLRNTKLPKLPDWRTQLLEYFKG